MVKDKEQMQKIYEVFEHIKNTPGKNDKVRLVFEYQDVEYFREILKFLYDDTITTGISSKKMNKKFEGLHTVRGFSTFLDLCNHVSQYNTGSDSTIRSTQTHLREYNDEVKEFLSQVIAKQYKCGMTATTVNKALGDNFIPKFEVQLAHPFEKFEHKVEGEFVLTQKLDGHRTLAFIDTLKKEVVFRTRKGHEIKGLDDIKDSIFRYLHFPNNQFNLVLDGEILIEDDSIAEEDKFSETSKIIRKDGEKHGLVFHVFDFVLQEEFDKGISEFDYKDRSEMLGIIFGRFGYDYDTTNSWISLVSHLYVGDDKTVIPQLLKEHIKLGHEGLMLNTLNGLYRTKRSPELLKIKEFHSADILVLDVFEGTGKYKESLGGIVVDYNGNEVRVGSGFIDSDRDYFWANPDGIIGKIVEVQYFGESKNQKDDNVSLRFPTFKGIRHDKTVEDINIE